MDKTKHSIVQIGTQNHTKVVRMDDVGPGGAFHHYRVIPVGDNPETARIQFTRVVFQKGPINETGVNGCHNEDVLAIVADRLECFQDGPFACVENARALGCIYNALEALNARTHKRQAQGVEGTSETHKPDEPPETKDEPEALPVAETETETIIMPTVGRMVHFYQNRQNSLMGKFYNDAPAAAIVVDVHSPRTVDLSVFDHEGDLCPTMVVQLRQPGDDIPEAGTCYCEWMPYQLGQAMKTEAAERAAVVSKEAADLAQ